ncbi:HET domain-containing protein [Colletotrichum caudatum]|nr:HET domain-containing protein [Colletotrichum caudatum]
MEQDRSYRYQPLPPIAEQGRTLPFTRLLLLHPGSGEDPSEAQLQIISVEDAPPYEALFYTWGKPTDEPRDYTWLQGYPLPVKPNLEDALRSLRLPTKVRRLWIDALCIDQSNLDERSRRVQCMRLVYIHAARVIVWLGLKTAGTQEAFLAAERLARIREYTHPGPNAAKLDTDACVQEVVASTWAIAKIEYLEMSFFDLIASLATDDRDKVFSLLGICDEWLNPVLTLTQVFENNDSWRIRLIRRGFARINNFVNGLASRLHFGRPRALRPDYKRETVLVYCDLTRFLMRKQPRILDVFDHVQHNEEPDLREYPSWVPKWFKQRTCFVFKGAYLAGFCDGHFRYFAELHDILTRDDPVRPMVLSLDGYHVDMVHKTSDTFDFGWGSGATALAIKHGGLNPVLDDRTQKPREELDEEVQELAATFLAQMAEFGLPPTADEYGHPEREEKLQSFGAGARTYSNSRRAFMTRDGRVGIGPKMMQPGDEVVVLFGGRMLFIARSRGDHRLLVGSCYMVDDELMWGKVTEKVRFNRGGPPRVTFEFH